MNNLAGVKNDRNANKDTPPFGGVVQEVPNREPTVPNDGGGRRDTKAGARRKGQAGDGGPSGVPAKNSERKNLLRGCDGGAGYGRSDRGCGNYSSNNHRGERLVGDTSRVTRVPIVLATKGIRGSKLLENGYLHSTKECYALLEVGSPPNIEASEPGKSLVTTAHEWLSANTATMVICHAKWSPSSIVSLLLVSEDIKSFCPSIENAHSSISDLILGVMESHKDPLTQLTVLLDLLSEAYNKGWGFDSHIRNAGVPLALLYTEKARRESEKYPVYDKKSSSGSIVANVCYKKLEGALNCPGWGRAFKMIVAHDESLALLYVHPSAPPLNFKGGLEDYSIRPPEDSTKGVKLYRGSKKDIENLVFQDEKSLH